MPTFNEDPAQRVLLHTDRIEWAPSPLPGVTRRMLARTGDEIARATSIVRYAPGSVFSAHTHGGGEEFLVLEGVFSDEHGDYPAGWYLRNPPGTSHTPSSSPGCLIFVKLWRFAADDLTPVRLNTHAAKAWTSTRDTGVEVCPLHRYGPQLTVLERWAPHAESTHDAAPHGEELLVIEGELSDDHGRYPAGTWLRQPLRAGVTRRAGPAGARVYRETGASRVPLIRLPST